MTQGGVFAPFSLAPLDYHASTRACDPHRRGATRLRRSRRVGLLSVLVALLVSGCFGAVEIVVVEEDQHGDSRLPAGTYYVRIEGFLLTTVGRYRLFIE